MTKLQRYKHLTASRVLVAKKAIKPKLIDRLVYFAAIIQPLFSLPQAYQIFHARSAADVSILTWLGFEVMAVIWLWYAIVHKDRLILLYQGMFFLIDGSVLVGAIIYGAKLF
jgi:uncharacterized protein with PQ loop repeat